MEENIYDFRFDFLDEFSYCDKYNNPLKFFKTHTELSIINSIQTDDIYVLNYVKSILIDKTYYVYNNNIPLTEEFNKFLIINNIKHIIFDEKFNQNIDNLPDIIETIIILGRYCISINKLPNNLITLLLNYNVSCHINYFSPNLVNIINNNCILNSLCNYCPNNLKFIQLGTYFNDEIHNLSSSIEIIILGKYFNKSIENLPQNISHLILNISNNLNENLINKIQKINPNISICLYTDSCYEYYY